MEAPNKELFVIVAGLLCFLLICVTAVVLFFRQWRKERDRTRKTQDHDRRF